MTSGTPEISADMVVTTLNEDGVFPAVIVCEHASNYIPERFDNLGLAKAEQLSHIAWDPGAADVARHLSQLLDAPYVRCEVSRLVYDCNRPPDAHDAMPAKSEVFEVPGNQNITQAERNARAEQVYYPFKHALEKTIVAHVQLPALITIHSFTPVYKGAVRTVELGILNDSDTTLADAMLENAHVFTSLNTQRNEPYGPEDGVTHTLQVHGIANSIPNVMIEIRNDLISTSEDCKKMADMLCRLIMNSLIKIGHVGSNESKEQAS